MWQVVVISGNGTYYPVAFFAEQAEADRFAMNQIMWQGVYVEQVKSVELCSVVVDASRWKVTK